MEKFIDRKKFIELPKARLARFHWRQKSWGAYELADGQKIMSIRQISLFVGQSKQEIKNFVQLNNLETLNVQIPNKRVIQAYNLNTVALLLQLLLKRNELEKHKKITLPDKDWKDLIEQLLNPERKVKPLNCKLKNLKARAVKIKIYDSYELEILYTSDHQYYIDFQEGLKVIHIDNKWLTDFSSRKVKIISDLNISEVFQCFVNYNTSKLAFSYVDWLSIWQYFSNKGNKYAIALLVQLAQESINTRVKTCLQG